MTLLIFLVMGLLCPSLLTDSTDNTPKNEEPQAIEATVEVYIFLHESCRISQFFTLTLKDLHEQYGSEEVVFKGIFPNQNTEESAMIAFKEKHDLKFEMIFDEQQAITQKLGANVTPEAIVYDVQNDKILYKGRIDNSYYRVGKRRGVTTTSELGDVLEAVKQGACVEVESQPAIGCYIKKIR